MPDTENNSLNPADPPETQPPGSSPQTESDSDPTSTDGATRSADPPETQGGGT